MGLIASAFALLVSAILVFRWPRVAHWLGLVCGLVALFWFYGIEFRYPFPALNTWIVFNFSDAMPDAPQEILFSKLKIALAISVLATTAMSATCLLPTHWIIRARPVRDRVWPAIAVSIFATLFWYVISVSPYRIPLIVDGVTARLTILHVDKKGRQFHETGISIFQDGKVYSFHNDRKLFQYRFPIHAGSAILSQGNLTREAAFVLAGELAKANTAPAVRLRSQEAEGWYVRTPRNVLAFSSEDGTLPPPKLLTVFRDLESVAPATNQTDYLKDICFGFCYDPLAGLGIVYLNDRCTFGNGAHCK